MTETPPAGRPKAAPLDVAASQDGVVTRSPALQLTAADFCTVLYQGRDFHLSLFTIEPFVSAFAGFRDGAIGPGKVDVDQKYVETARVRLTPAAAIHIIGNLLYNLKAGDPDAYHGALPGFLGILADETAEK